MQVTRPNEIRRPGVSLHPKACAALGLEAERATPKRLGTLVPRTCMHALGTGYARKSGEPLGFRPKEGTCASTGAISPPGVAWCRFVGGQQSGLAGSKPPPLFTRGASSCSSQGRRQGEPWGASLRPSAPTYLPTLKKKTSSTNCQRVLCPKGEIIPVTDACDVAGGGTPYQWQELNPAELSYCQFPISGVNLDGTLKPDYPANEWRLVPLGHWNWKWNQARSNYSTYDLELLAGLLVLSSQSRLLGANPIVRLYHQKPVETVQNGCPAAKAKLKRWWTYLSQFRLTVHHIQGIKNKMADHTSCNNFDALLGESSEAVAGEAFQHIDVHLDLSMRTAGVLEGLSLRDYQADYQCVLS